MKRIVKKSIAHKLLLPAMALGVVALGTPMSAQAASSPAVGMGVTATVAAKCLISATTTVAFGTYDSVDLNAASPLDGTGVVTIRCTPGSGTSIALDKGANASGSGISAQRRMRLGATTNHLNYSLFQDAARTTPWGDGTDAGNAQTILPAANGSPQNFTVYGRIPAGQDVAVGSYVDTVQATVNF